MVTGRVPFDSDTLTGIMSAILAGRYDPPVRDNAPAPRAVTRIIARCLEVDPKRRYATAEALLTDVRAALSLASFPAPALLAGPRIVIRPRLSGERAAALRRRAPLWGSVVVAVLALAFLVSSLRDYTCCTPPAVEDSTHFAGHGPAAPVRDTVLAPTAVLRPVIIRVFGEMPAEVFRDGRLIGTTPVHFEARIGDWIELVLRRPGHAERTERFQVIDGTNEYTYDLQRTLNESANAPPD
jgi:hypothetical protein